MAQSSSSDIPSNWDQRSTTVKGPLQSIQTPYVILGLLAIIALFITTVLVVDWVQGFLFLIGLALGMALLYARFGFTSAFRRLVSVGNVQGLQAHMLMLAVATTLFALIFSSGFSFTGVEPTGYVSPVGISLLVGAFMFGIGMQLGSGCASGTLYSVGGGSSSMVVTLFFFIVGSVIGAYHLAYWQTTPSLGPISLAETTGFGFFGGWALQMALFAIIYFGTVLFARWKNPPKMKPLTTTTGFKKILRGAWPLFSAAIVLAVLNALVLAVRGTPWGITSAFALWGGKVLDFVGVDVASWDYFTGANAEALSSTVLADSTSVLNFGIMLGAFVSAALQGTFRPKRVKPGVVGASVIGGLLMGYGARLAYGCNIGAYFGGIASFSLHGWIWAVMAILGTVLALYIRPLFGLSNPKPKDSLC